MLKNILMHKVDLHLKNKLINVLKNGGIAVIPTDTIYGIVGSALNPKTIEEIYKLRKRKSSKPFIILISSLDDLNTFNIKLTNKQKEFLEKIWPNPVSVVLKCPDNKWKYLHRGTNSLAFRVPKDNELFKLLKEVGPLVAPSANFEGDKPAQMVDEAKKYFGNKVSFYVDGGQIKSQPSTLIFLNNDGSYKILRGSSYQFFT